MAFVHSFEMLHCYGYSSFLLNPIVIPTSFPVSFFHNHPPSRPLLYFSASICLLEAHIFFDVAMLRDSCISLQRGEIGNKGENKFCAILDQRDLKARVKRYEAMLFDINFEFYYFVLVLFSHCYQATKAHSKN